MKHNFNNTDRESTFYYSRFVFGGDRPQPHRFPTMTITANMPREFEQAGVAIKELQEQIKRIQEVIAFLKRKFPRNRQLQQAERRMNEAAAAIAKLDARWKKYWDNPTLRPRLKALAKPLARLAAQIKRRVETELRRLDRQQLRRQVIAYVNRGIDLVLGRRRAAGDQPAQGGAPRGRAPAGNARRGRDRTGRRPRGRRGVDVGRRRTVERNQNLNQKLTALSGTITVTPENFKINNVTKFGKVVGDIFQTTPMNWQRVIGNVVYSRRGPLLYINIKGADMFDSILIDDRNPTVIWEYNDLNRPEAHPLSEYTSGRERTWRKPRSRAEVRRTMTEALNAIKNTFTITNNKFTITNLSAFKQNLQKLVQTTGDYWQKVYGNMYISRQGPYFYFNMKGADRFDSVIFDISSPNLMWEYNQSGTAVPYSINDYLGRGARTARQPAGRTGAGRRPAAGRGRGRAGAGQPRGGSRPRPGARHTPDRTTGRPRTGAEGLAVNPELSNRVRRLKTGGGIRFKIGNKEYAVFKDPKNKLYYGDTRTMRSRPITMAEVGRLRINRAPSFKPIHGNQLYVNMVKLAKKSVWRTKSMTFKLANNQTAKITCKSAIRKDFWYQIGNNQPSKKMKLEDFALIAMKLKPNTRFNLP